MPPRQPWLLDSARMKIEMMPEDPPSLEVVPDDPPSLEVVAGDGKKGPSRHHAADPKDQATLWPASVARVPGEGEEEEDWEDIEAKIRIKYQPAKLDVSGGPAQAAAHQRPAASFPSGRPEVHVCNGCDGQGKVFRSFVLSDLGSQGAQRVLESCCQQCEGMGVVYPNKPEDERGGSAGGGEGHAQSAGSSGRLDQDDPVVDIDAILAAAGPSPFDRPRKPKHH